MEKLLPGLAVLLPCVIGMVAETGRNCIELYPRRQDILKHSALELNCSIKDTCGQYSSSDLYYTEFYYRNDYTLNWTLEFDNTTLGLRLPNTSLLYIERGDVRVHCRLRPEGAKVSADVRVIDRPVVLEQMRCEVVSMALTCNWGTKPTDNCNKAHLTLRKRGSPEDELRDCPIRSIGIRYPHKTSCTWNLPSHGVYDLHVFCYTIDVHQLTLDTREIERPLRVEEINFTGIGARSVNMSWSAEGTREQRYHVVVSTHGSVIKSLNTTSTNASFDGLYPFREHVINITSRYITNGQRSDVKSDNFTTLSDVPESHPEVSAGGWIVVSNVAREFKTVRLIFKEVKEHEKIHPPSFHYRVDVHPKDGSCPKYSNDTLTLPKNRSIVIPNSCDVNVAVRAENRNGTARGRPKTMWIPHKGIPWPENVTFIATKDSQVNVAWTPFKSSPPTTGYTIYWYDYSHETKDYNLLTLGPEADNAIVNLPGDYWKFSFGMSRQIENSSTGVKWMVHPQGGCIYDQKHPPGQPEQLGTTPGERGQVITWMIPDCDIKTSYPYAYQLRLYRSSRLGHLKHTSNVSAATGGKMKKTLEGLVDGTDYMVEVQSIGHGGLSVSAKMNFTYMAPKKSDNLYLKLIILCIPVVLVGSACLLWGCKKQVGKWHRGVTIVMLESPTSFNTEKPSVVEYNDIQIERGHTPSPKQKRTNPAIINNNSKHYTADRKLYADPLEVMDAGDDFLKDGYIKMDGGNSDTVNHIYISKNGFPVPKLPASAVDRDNDIGRYINSPTSDTGNEDCSFVCVHMRPQESLQSEVEVTNEYVLPTDSAPEVDKHSPCHDNDYQLHSLTAGICCTTAL